MGSYFRRYRGEATATGVMPIVQYPDFSNGKDQINAYLGVMGVRQIALQIDGLDGTVELQGNNGNPNTAGEWYTIEELAADGRIIKLDDPVDFIRVNVTAITSGTTVAMLTLES